MTNPGCESLYRTHFPFWDNLTDSEKFDLCSHTSFSHYKKGENIHGRNGECTGVIFVKSGQLRAYMLSEEGREITLYRLNEGDICMLSASCVLNTITFDVFVDSETDSEVFIINPNTFSTLSDHNIYVENFALSVATARFS